MPNFLVWHGLALLRERTVHVSVIRQWSVVITSDRLGRRSPAEVEDGTVESLLQDAMTRTKRPVFRPGEYRFVVRTAGLTYSVPNAEEKEDGDTKSPIERLKGCLCKGSLREQITLYFCIPKPPAI